MRNTLFIALALISASSGCKWTDFDDLENEMWVESIEKPDSNSADYAVALARSQRVQDDGGTLTVLGAGQALYTELSFKAPGGGSLASDTEQKLNNQFGIGTLDPDPILIADPDTDDVALVTNSGGNGSIAVLSGTHGLMSSQVFGPTTPDAAIYFKAASQTTSKVFVASESQVFGFAPGAAAMNYCGTSTPSQQQCCQLVDDAATPIKVRGMAPVRLPAATDDDLAVWAGDGKVYFYPGLTFDGCLTATAPMFSVDLAFADPARNSRMFTVGDKYLIVGGAHDTGDGKAQLSVVDFSVNPPVIVGTPIGRDGLKSLAYLDVPDGHQYVLAGFPVEEVDGTVAGQVLALPFDTTTGTINPIPAMILHDAQPSGNQLFGRALAVVPFNGKPAIAVAAASEVFFYYQATPLYDELRRR